MAGGRDTGGPGHITPIGRRRITRSGTNLAKTRKGRRRARRGPGKNVLMSTAARARPSGGPQQPELTSAKDQQKPARWA
jgi:hypothetical protein